MSEPDESAEELVDESGRNATQRQLDAQGDTDREVDAEWSDDDAGADDEVAEIEEPEPPIH